MPRFMLKIFVCFFFFLIFVARVFDGRALLTFVGQFVFVPCDFWLILKAKWRQFGIFYHLFVHVDTEHGLCRPFHAFHWNTL